MVLVLMRNFKRYGRPRWNGEGRSSPGIADQSLDSSVFMGWLLNKADGESFGP